MEHVFPLVLVVLWALSGMVQYGSGEEVYGGASLHFSGQLITTGSCRQLAENLIRCQVPAGMQGTLQLTATVTPSTYPVSIAALALPPWTNFQPVSMYGAAQVTCTFLPPPETAGSSFELRFRASTAYAMYLDLVVILEVMPSAAEYRTDSRGKFSVPVEELPDTWVTGTLTRCGNEALGGVPVIIELIPREGRDTIRTLIDIGTVKISSPGYGETLVPREKLGFLSSMDPSGRVQRTVDVGVVCLQPSGGPIPLGSITGITDADGKFSKPFPEHPGIVVTGRLTECGQRPLPEQEFSLTPIQKGDEVAGFELEVPGYKPVVITDFNQISFFGLTRYILGDLCLSPEIGEEETPAVSKGCGELLLRILTQNMMLIPKVPEKHAPFRDQRAKVLTASLGEMGEWGRKFDIICFQEVWHYRQKGNMQYKNAVLRGWLGDSKLNLDETKWWREITPPRKGGKDQTVTVDGAQVNVLARQPAAATKTVRVAIFKKGNRYAVTGPDSTAGWWRWTFDSGLMILSKYPVIAVSAFVFSDQAGAKSILEPWTTEEVTNKGALYARVLLDPHNSECYIHVFTVHLAAGVQNAPHRAKQLKELLEFIDACTRDKQGKPDGRPIILCGDLNIIGGSPEWQNSLGNLKAAVGQLKDAWLSSGKKEDQSAVTWVGMDQPLDPKSPWGKKNVVASASGKPQRLDYILYFAGKRCISLELKTIDREPTQRQANPYPWNGYTLSDHLGVQAEFKVKPIKR